VSPVLICDLIYIAAQRQEVLHHIYPTIFGGKVKRSSPIVVVVMVVVVVVVMVVVIVVIVVMVVVSPCWIA
jgi:hypothetical protein